MTTIIELFDSEQIENIVSCFAFKPDKLIFIGYKIPTKKRKAIENFVHGRGLFPEFEYITIYDYEMIDVIRKIENIVNENEDCAFELTGGDEVIAAAVGYVAVSRNLKIFRYDIPSRRAIGIYNCIPPIPDKLPQMSIEEAIKLHNGTIVKQDTYPKWSMSEEFINDVMTFWKIYSKNCSGWNQYMQRLSLGSSEFSKRHVTGTFLQTHIPVKIFRTLMGIGFIKDFELIGNKFSFTFKNSELMHLFVKAGNMLELYTYINVRNITEGGESFFSDSDIGVMIDLGNTAQTRNSGTRNEIDVIAMRGVTPVFISCKSGEFKKEALYELQAVAEKFGGQYAKKILVTTYIGSENTAKYIRQRAQDMGIVLIDHVHEKTPEQLQTEIKNAVGGYRESANKHYPSKQLQTEYTEEQISLNDEILMLA